ncbi:lytic transglycosylase domain-containing protein [Planomonospora sp. ID67723]|uniref:lytic transglycosylase domain-containing protein n=1 Tax=Planomonospora sp. ID67723 TaxID=2738134 RepID=UPI0018C431ED|nr:lytic transglycosylase domain-containing protein [Planomonospora sp. ID67723]MBG0830775.1 lytic transglycosylase domain-containing protein [Planomonospora sp. ID67723]
MKDQHAKVARPGRVHRPGGRTTPAQGDAAGGGVPGAGRSRGKPLAASLVGLAVAISGCTGAQSAASPAAPGAVVTRPAQAQSAPPAKQLTRRAPAPPAPDAAIPKDASRLARALTGTTAQLRRAIDDWVRAGGPAGGRPPEPVALLALHQQRIYRYLARNQKTASRTYAELPKALAGPARANVTAIRDLLSLAHPVSDPAKFRVRQPEPADALLGHFRHAERRFGVDWEILAAVMFVETKFGRVRSPSHTGAKGPMQFMPGTWAAYGMGGDVHDTRDAILAAANYLHASGAPRNYRRALYAYNHSWAYVNAVRLHARQIKQDIRNYYAYYNWQVFVITTRGERRLSGP